jgi:hypothetical protein
MNEGRGLDLLRVSPSILSLFLLKLPPTGVSCGSIFVFDIVKVWQASERAFLHAFLGTRK